MNEPHVKMLTGGYCKVQERLEMDKWSSHFILGLASCLVLFRILHIVIFAASNMDFVRVKGGLRVV